MDTFLAEELRSFYACFENEHAFNLSIDATADSAPARNGSLITVSEDQVRRALKSMNIRKVAGPDGIIGCALKSCTLRSCADFLAQAVVPTCF